MPKRTVKEKIQSSKTKIVDKQSKGSLKRESQRIKSKNNDIKDKQDKGKENNNTNIIINNITIAKPCKRGFKVCKNIKCQILMHINSRECKNCGEINQTKKNDKTFKDNIQDQIEELS